MLGEEGRRSGTGGEVDGTEGRGDDGMIKAFCQVGKSASKDFGIASGRFGQ